ncbi:MAG TPA: hypothetical protein VFB58_15930 [Chloroflexota bacterium]|nr:hypothetical protein [Chloroflexota bacterium]
MMEDADGLPTKSAGTEIALWGCGGAALLLAVALVIAVFVTTFRSATSVPSWQRYPAGSAPGTLARFLVDLQDNDLHRAYKLTLAGQAGRGSPTWQRFHREFAFWPEVGRHIKFERIRVRENAGVVTVRLDIPPGGRPSDPVAAVYRMTYHLVRHHHWVIKAWSGTYQGFQP